MRKIIIPLVFVFMLATAFTVSTVMPVSADVSAKPQHDGECPFKNL